MNNNSALNPNIVKTALDLVFFPAFNAEMHPGLVTAESSATFNQETTDRAAEIVEVFKGAGLWETRAEEQDVPQGQFKVGNNKTYTVTNYAQSLDISKNLFDDDQHNVINKAVTDMARKGRMTRDRNAFAVYRNAFTTALTADGAALVSDSHTTLAGVTVDNKITTALSESSLNTAIIMMVEQKSQDGVISGSMPKVLLVPPALFKLACEITESELKSGTGNNDMNVYSAKYGIQVVMSPWIGTAAGGSDTAWYLLGDNHSITRWVRQDIKTDIVDYKFQRNNNYIYKGEFREVVGAIDYVGVVGSTGTV
jgi:phage major head subunit gpT-like protein